MPAADHGRGAGHRRSAARRADLDLESLPPLVVSSLSRDPREPADPVGAAAAGRRTRGVQRPDRPAGRKRSIRGRGHAGPTDADQGRSFGTGLGARRRAQVLGNNGSVIANADDTNIPLPARNGQQAQSLVVPDPSLELTIPGGTNEITLVIRDLENRGGIGFPYRIVVEPLCARFRDCSPTNRRSAFRAAARPAWA